MAGTGAELWLIAGPNGAGKTTFTQAEPIRRLLPHVVALNADDRTAERLRAAGYPDFTSVPADPLRAAFFAAAEAVQAEAAERLGRGEAVCVETVLSTNKFEELVAGVRRAGGFFGLIYVALGSPALACARVARRARRGGHDVPREKTVARYHRSLENLGRFAAWADRFWVFDNSDSDPDAAPLLLAEGGSGRALKIHDPAAIPGVTRVLTAAFPPRG